jgi:hypothetical protein
LENISLVFCEGSFFGGGSFRLDDSLASEIIKNEFLDEDGLLHFVDSRVEGTFF